MVVGAHGVTGCGNGIGIGQFTIIQPHKRGYNLTGFRITHGEPLLINIGIDVEIITALGAHSPEMSTAERGSHGTGGNHKCFHTKSAECERENKGKYHRFKRFPNAGIALTRRTGSSGVYSA